MSKIYSRARSPPSSLSPSRKSPKRSSSHTFDSPSKSYKTYSKYDDEYDRSKYDKDDKKYGKSDYKTYSSSKDYDLDSYSRKSPKSDSYAKASKKDLSYREVSLPKRSSYSYSDRDSYSLKYPSSDNDGYSRYSSLGKDPDSSKYKSRTGSSTGTTHNSKRYSPYSSTSNKTARVSDSKRYSPYSTTSKDRPISKRYSPYSTSSRGQPSGDSKRYSPYTTSCKNVSGLVTDSERYSPYASERNVSYVKYDSDPYYNVNEAYDSYGSYGKVSSRFDSSKDTFRSSDNEYARGGSPSRTYSNYERYVIGDSVVYGSPGHYPKDLCPRSPNSKASYRTPSPPSKVISRYSRSSPGRGSRGCLKKSPSRLSPYVSRIKSPSRRPPSPPPVTSYRQLSPSGYSKGSKASMNRTPPLGNNKRDRYINDTTCQDAKGKLGRNNMCDYNNYQDSHTSSYNDRPKMFPPRPRPIGSPKPLLSIPLTLKNVPRESRASVRDVLETGCTGNEKRFFGKRFEGRIGTQGIKRKSGLPSPPDLKKRRPDDLRLWIESRKSGGVAKKWSPPARKGRGLLSKALPSVVGHAPRSHVMDSRRRILTKGKRKSGLATKADIKRRPAISTKSRSRLTRETSPTLDKDKIAKEGMRRSSLGENRKEERTKKRKRKEDEGRVTSNRPHSREREETGSSANTHRVIKRPRVISKANSLPLKARPLKKTIRKSSKENGKNDKTQKRTKFKPKGKPRSLSRERSKDLLSSKERSKDLLSSRARSKDLPSSQERSKDLLSSRERSKDLPISRERSKGLPRSRCRSTDRNDNRRRSRDRSTSSPREELKKGKRDTVKEKEKRQLK